MMLNIDKNTKSLTAQTQSDLYDQLEKKVVEIRSLNDSQARYSTEIETMKKQLQAKELETSRLLVKVKVLTDREKKTNEQLISTEETLGELRQSFNSSIN